MPDPIYAAVPPNEAIAYLKQKGFKTSFAWEDVWQDEHSKAFTVAKMMQRDLLEDTKNALEDAMKNGKTFEQFRQELAPTLISKGWWGKKEMTDPLTGEVKKVQLGSTRRLKTIFDTNIRTSYAQAHWSRIDRTKKQFPYLLYDAVNDGRTRPLHKKWDGTLLPVDDPWWDTHYPPCGWRCRCQVIQMRENDLSAMNMSVTRFAPTSPPTPYKNPRSGEIIMIERGIDPGFNYNVGKAPLRGLTPKSMPLSNPKKDTGAIITQASERFLKAFSATKKPQIIKDRSGWPIVISKDLFTDAEKNPSIPNFAQIENFDLVADALKNYDSAEWVWQEAKDKSEVLIRRYKKRLDKGLLTVDFSRDYWTWKIT